MKKGNVVQITDADHKWFSCFVIVDEVKSWGITGYVPIRRRGRFMVRLNEGMYESVGEAAIMEDKP